MADDRNVYDDHGPGFRPDGASQGYCAAPILTIHPAPVYSLAEARRKLLKAAGWLCVAMNPAENYTEQGVMQAEAGLRVALDDLRRSYDQIREAKTQDRPVRLEVPAPVRIKIADISDPTAYPNIARAMADLEARSDNVTYLNRSGNHLPLGGVK